MNMTPVKIVERRSFKKIIQIFFKFVVSDSINSILLWLKRNRKYSFDNNRYKGINLGSSTICPAAWIGISGGIAIFLLNMPKFLLQLGYNFSKKSKKRPFQEFYNNVKDVTVKHHNLFYGIPFHDNAIPYLFSSHFFEHLTHESALYLAQEAFRVLRPGGMVRIVVPALEQEVAHLESAIQAYKSGDTAPVQRFVTEEYVDLKDNFSHHRYMYTGPNLIALLEQAGFANCQLCQSGEGNFPDINLLENRPGVIVEAIKP